MNLTHCSVPEPQFDRLHDDPRWLPFLRKVGYAPEQLAKIEFNVKLPRQAKSELAGAGESANVPAAPKDAP